MAPVGVLGEDDHIVLAERATRLHGAAWPSQDGTGAPSGIQAIGVEPHVAQRLDVAQSHLVAAARRAGPQNEVNDPRQRAACPS